VSINADAHTKETPDGDRAAILNRQRSCATGEANRQILGCGQLRARIGDNRSANRAHTEADRIGQTGVGVKAAGAGNPGTIGDRQRADTG
jgi:hypothetical protein